MPELSCARSLRILLRKQTAKIELTGWGVLIGGGVCSMDLDSDPVGGYL